MLLSQAVGLAAVVLALALRGAGAPELSRLLPAVAAGVAGLVGLVAFYRALAIGTMSIVAPIAAGGMGLPVAVGILGGDRLGVVRWVGMAAAVAGVVLVSRERHEGKAPPAAARQSVLLALVAALGFGAFALGLRSGARADVLWALAAARCGCLVPLAVVLGLRVGGRMPRLSTLAPVAVIGVLDVSANGLYALATRHGLLSVVGVGSSLYPLVTVLLARLLLRERVQRSQELGIAVVLVGVAAIAAG